MTIFVTSILRPRQPCEGRFGVFILNQRCGNKNLGLAMLLVRRLSWGSNPDWLQSPISFGHVF